MKVLQNFTRFLFVGLLFLLIAGCGGGGGGGATGEIDTTNAPGRMEASIDEVSPDEVNPGGIASVSRFDTNAFSERAPLLGFRGDANFKSGNLLFRGVQPGLGPVFNTNSCQSCHVKDGRGNPPASQADAFRSIVLKIFLPGSPSGDPIYGGQLQTFGVATTDGLSSFGGSLPTPSSPVGAGALGEGFAFITYEPVSGSYPDGSTYQLRRPVYKVRDLSYGNLQQGVVLAPRVANSVSGMGLLEAIPEEDILLKEDPEDSDGDMVSGRANMIADVISGDLRLGRFGHKAANPSILQQLAEAYREDMGITNSLFPEENCTENQVACTTEAASEADAASGGTDITDLELALVEFYVRHLAVPRRRGFADGSFRPEILAGRRLFFQANCTSCHTPRQRTGALPSSVLGNVNLNQLEGGTETLTAVSNTVIYPYTDLLLHDMGGECAPAVQERADGSSCDGGQDCLWVQRCNGLADGRPDGLAGGSEWRTAPLWGAGLAKTVNPNAGFLHDGRARTLEEAILWHGGEAEVAKQSFMNFSASERSQLISFLESL